MSDLLRRTLLAVAVSAGLASCAGHGQQAKSGTPSSAYGRSGSTNGAPNGAPSGANGAPGGSTNGAPGGSGPGAPSGSFAGRVVGATGRLAGEANRVTLHLRSSGGSGTRRLTVSFVSPSCANRPHCIQLAGSVTGRLVQGPALADRGRTFAISARGAVEPLAQAEATGTVTGTGNTRFGHESLSLTLSGRSGQVVLVAQSGPVAGFTSP